MPHPIRCADPLGREGPGGQGGGIEGSLHRCRHTYATELLRAGANIRVVQTLMRHASLSSTQIYTAVDENERREGIRRLGA